MSKQPVLGGLSRHERREALLSRSRPQYPQPPSNTAPLCTRSYVNVFYTLSSLIDFDFLRFFWSLTVLRFVSWFAVVFGSSRSSGLKVRAWHLGVPLPPLPVCRSMAAVTILLFEGLHQWVCSAFSACLLAKSCHIDWYSKIGNGSVCEKLIFGWQKMWLIHAFILPLICFNLSSAFHDLNGNSNSL